MRNMVKHPRRLTERQARFILAYLATPDATKAAIKAGYSPKTAKEIGFALLHKNSLVRSEIAARGGKMMAKQEITIERTLAENAAIAFRDPRRLFRQDGTMLSPHEWPDDLAAAVASIETREFFEGEGENRKIVGFTRKVRFEDKGGA